jgi:hypothetical protein
MQTTPSPTDPTGVLDEAYERLHRTGPEFEGWLSNHGPMASEALVRMGTCRTGSFLARRLPRTPGGTAPTHRTD